MLITQFVYYRSRNDNTGIVVHIIDAQKNGVDITGLNALAFTEVDAVNQPGIYRINLTDAVLTGVNVTAVKGDVIEIFINGLSGGNSAPVAFKFTVTEETLDSIATRQTSIESKVDIIDTNVDDILSDTEDMQPRVVDIEIDVDANRTTLESGISGLDALKALIDAVQSSVDGISNVTRFSASVPSESVIPPAGNTDSRINMQLVDNNGNLEDPDADQIEVSAFDASGVDVTGAHLIFGGQANNGNGKVDAVKDSQGQYRVEFRVPNTADPGLLTLKFEYKEGGNPIASTRATVLVDEIQAGGTALETTSQDILADTADMQPKIDAINTIIFDAGNGLAAIKALLAIVDGKADTLIADIQSGVFGLPALKTLIDSKASQASITALQNSITDDVKGAGFDQSKDTLHQLSLRTFSGGEAI